MGSFASDDEEAEATIRPLIPEFEAEPSRPLLVEAEPISRAETGGNRKGKEMDGRRAKIESGQSGICADAKTNATNRDGDDERNGWSGIAIYDAGITRGAT